ncbi:MAG: GreA/GreB family elongation factor [Eubacteriales bacterium]
MLAHAVIIDDASDDIETVGTGCKVLIVDEVSGKQYEYQIVGSQEANPIQGRISDESPLGKALVGSRVDDIVEFEAPVGIMRYKIESISR